MPKRLAVVLLLGGCATVPRSSSPLVESIHMEPLKLEVVRGPDGTRVEAFDAATLFEQAGADLNGGRYREAAAAYDRLLANFPASHYRFAALYNAGLAFEGKRDFTAAAERYRRLVELGPVEKDLLDALFRLGGCYAEVGNWPASTEAYGRVLGRQGLSLGDRVEAGARRGLAQYQMKDLGAAERTLRDTLAFYRANETLERLDSDFFLAMCQYYLAEISHDRFRAIPVRLPENQMKRDLEAKAELLLTAQGRYVDTARVRNPAWATAAGYQMASLYKEFYDALLAAPIPPQLNAEARKIYVEELRKTIEPLLRKAIHAHELTQAVAERNSIDNEWVRKSNDQMEELRALLTQPEELPSHGPVRRSRPIQPEKIEPSPSPTRPEDYHPRVLL